MPQPFPATAFGALILASLLVAALRGTWRLAIWSCGAALALALANWFAQLLTPTAPGLLLLAPLNSTVLVLVAFLGLVIIRYTATSLATEPDSGRFLRWLLLTLLAVALTLISNHLLVFWLAWVAIGLSLHQLLMFYPERPRAALAAHKHFLFARAAELLLAAAFLLLYHHHGNARISDILAHYPAATLAMSEQLAALLLVLVALIKCAQLPVHGWLVQVVEAPTPVSALLHAGVVNLGGFLLLQFAPLLSSAPLARWVLLILAGISLLLAGAIAMTRISIKVRLAWSTIAQMGLMLLECGLGLYSLALLHLLAHSCYKASAFLTAGNAVEAELQARVAGTCCPPVRKWLLAACPTAALTAGTALLWQVPLPLSPWLLLVQFGAAWLALASQRSMWAVLTAGLSLTVLLNTYAALKTALAGLLPVASVPYGLAADLWVCLVFTTLCGIYWLVQFRLQWPAIRKLFIALNAGCYLDEWATRATLRLWPARLPRAGRKVWMLSEATP